MKDEALTFNHVCFHYQSKKRNRDILEGVNFSVKKGEFVSIVGASGSGKSTIFRLITGLEKPSEGKIFINGQTYANQSGKIGYMPQRDLLMPWRTVLENVRLPIELAGSDVSANTIQNML